MKFFVFLSMLLLCCTSFVMAATVVDVGKETVITTICLDGSGGFGNNATMRIVDEAGNEVLATTQMYQITNGTFGQNVTFTTEGTYSTQESCNFSGTVVSGGDTYIAKNSSDVSSSVDEIRQKVIRPTLTLSGTDYQISDNGTIFLSVDTVDGLLISSTQCQITAYYPNKSVEFNVVASYLAGSADIFYYDFLASNVSGIHIVDASCYTPITNVSVLTYYGNVSNIQLLKNSSTTDSDLGFGTVTSTDVCLSDFTEAQNDFFGGQEMLSLNSITNHTLYLKGSAARSVQVTVHFKRHNDLTGLDTEFSSVATNFSVTTSSQPYNMSDLLNLNQNFTTSDRLKSSICLKNFGGSASFDFLYGGVSTPSGFNRTGGSLNLTNAFSFGGSNELNIRDYSFKNNTALLKQINATTNQTGNVTNDILTNVTLIKNDTSYHTTLLAQIYTWVSGIFGWVQTDVDQNASTVITISTDQAVAFIPQNYFTNTQASILVQVQKGGNSVTATTCLLNVQYANLTRVITNGTMSYTGDDGLYNYTWIPVSTGSYPTRVSCSGGILQGTVQGVVALGVTDQTSGVNIQALS